MFCVLLCKTVATVAHIDYAYITIPLYMICQMYIADYIIMIILMTFKIICVTDKFLDNEPVLKDKSDHSQEF